MSSAAGAVRDRLLYMFRILGILLLALTTLKMSLEWKLIMPVVSDYELQQQQVENIQGQHNRVKTPVVLVASKQPLAKGLDAVAAEDLFAEFLQNIKAATAALSEATQPTSDKAKDKIPSAFQTSFVSSDTEVRRWNLRRDKGPVDGYGEIYHISEKDSISRVLILTLFKDSSDFLVNYFSLLSRIRYPKHLISLGFLEGDSSDDTFEHLGHILDEIASRHEYHRITIVRKNIPKGNKGLKGEARHSFEVQARRRSAQAKARNNLMSHSLMDEHYVMWLDSDLYTYPPDIVNVLIQTGKRVVTANCLARSGACYDRNNWRDSTESKTKMQQLPENVPVFEGYNHIFQTRREYLCDIVLETEHNGGVIALDGVGGAALLLDAQLVHEGLHFPTYTYHHSLETEGLAQMALSMGVQPYGLAGLDVIHDSH